MKKILTFCSLSALLVLGGCATYPDGSVHSAGCGTGTNYGGAAVGAVAGGLLGSAIGNGSGQAIATGVGAAGGAVLGSRSNIGC